jgi:hypothetical protein
MEYPMEVLSYVESMNTLESIPTPTQQVETDNIIPEEEDDDKESQEEDDDEESQEEDDDEELD